MKVLRPTSIEITPINDRAEFRFRLRSSGTHVAAEFVVSTGDLLKLTEVLQALVARHKPRSAGVPSLRIVTGDGETS